MLPNKHQRKQIRDVVYTMLAGNTTALENVFVNRFNSLEQEILPAICIYTGKEQSEKFNSQLYKRTLTLSIEIHSSKKDESDMVEELELIAGEVEVLLLQDEDLSGNCNKITLTSTDIVAKIEADEQIGAALMSYDVEYFTLFSADTPTNPLTQTDLFYENNTEGTVNLPQL